MMEEMITREERRPLVVASIPAYNEEATIGKIILLAQRYADKVVICDDGSTDMTAEIAEKLGAEVIKHGENMGYGSTIKSLFKRARELDADVMVTLDGDGQHNPLDIPTLVKPIVDEAADVAIGSRFLKNAHASSAPLYRRVGIKAITKLTKAATSSEMSDAQNGFRAYSRKALESLNLCENGMGVSVEILLKTREQGLKIVEVPASCNYQGLENTSTHDPLSHGASVVMSIVRLVVEKRPLLLLGGPGVVSLLLGSLLSIWMLQIYTVERRIVTNIALASISFVLIGFFAVTTAITLYAISRLMQKVNRP